MRTSRRGKLCLSGLSLTAMLITASTSALGQSVGDLSGYNGVSTASAAPYEVVGEAPVVNSSHPGRYAPVSVGDLQMTSASPAVVGNGAWTQDCGCSSDSAMSCGKPSCKKRRVGSLLDRRRGNDPWLRAELLLWFPQPRRSPALVTTAPAGLAPTIGLDDTEVVFGGEDGLGGDLTPGFRLDAGRYLSENFGIGGRFWFLGDDEASYAAQGDGSTMSIGRPIFDTDAGANDAILIAGQDAGGNPLFSGSVDAESTLDIIAAEAYGRLMFASGKEYRTDLIGGYTYFGIDDSLSVNSTSVQTGPATGRVLTFNDSITANNDFHGGQIGFETVLSRGKWMFSSLTKVHLGNMGQTLNISGTSTDVTPPGAATVNDGGALALDSIGNFERDVFTFAPEANVKLGYRFRDHVLFTVGYSFIYWDNVALGGDYANPVFDATTLATAGPFGQPPLTWEDRSLYVQGIDLGLVIDF